MVLEAYASKSVPRALWTAGNCMPMDCAKERIWLGEKKRKFKKEMVTNTNIKVTKNFFMLFRLEEAKGIFPDGRASSFSGAGRSGSREDSLRFLWPKPGMTERRIGPRNTIPISFTPSDNPKKNPAATDFRGFLNHSANAMNPNARYMPFIKINFVSSSRALSSVTKNAPSNAPTSLTPTLRRKK